MPVLRSINVIERKSASGFSDDTTRIVEELTADILKESPGLIVEVENGVVERAILEKEIVKAIDRKNYTGDRDKIIKSVLDFMFGFGELEEYINDPEITDIVGTQYDYFTIKKHGKTIEIPFMFSSPKHMESFCRVIAVRYGGLLNENDNHCELSDEKRRLRIIMDIYPRNYTGPILIIRKHSHLYTMNELQELGMITPDMNEFFQKVAHSTLNVFATGISGMGKTTWLRALINLIPKVRRALVAESVIELYPENKNFVGGKVKNLNEGGKPITLEDLIRDGLKMCLDCYIVGEIIGRECWELVKAALTGHQVMGSTHVGDPRKIFERFITLIKTAQIDLSEKTLKRMIADSVDLVVHIYKFKVTEVVEILGYDEEKDQILTNTLYRFNITKETASRIYGSFEKVGELSGKNNKKLIESDE